MKTGEAHDKVVNELTGDRKEIRDWEIDLYLLISDHVSKGRSNIFSIKYNLAESHSFDLDINIDLDR